MPFSLKTTRASLLSGPGIILFTGRNIGKIFLAGFLVCSLLGVCIFYFWGYRFTRQNYNSTIPLQGINRGLLTQTLQGLQGQQSKAGSAPATNPFTQ